MNLNRLVENALNWSGFLVQLLVASLLSIVIYLTYDGWSTELFVVVGLASAQIITFGITFSTWAKKSIKRRRTLLWFEAAFIVSLYFIVNEGTVAIFGIVWIVQAADLYDANTSSRLLILAIGMFTASQFYHWPEEINFISAFFASATLGVFHLFALYAIQRANREQQLREETASLNRELLATRDLLSQTTRQHERLRIARELHDLLGHHMTALILNLEVARHATQGKALEKVEQSVALAKLLLSDLRTAVTELREEDAIDLNQAIEKLIAGIPNLEISVDFSNAPTINDIDRAETLLRCIQESVTNVLRHSTANRCSIALSQAQGKCVLEVADNGTEVGHINPGNGLKGMEERVSANGGDLSWQQTNSGFSVRVQLPMAQL